MAADLEGQRVLIVGAGGGIGRASARAFAEAGAHVVATGRDPAKLEGVGHEAVALDFLDNDAVESFFADRSVFDHVVVAAAATTKGGFWGAAAIAGLAMGSSQSAGRAMTGVLAPPTQLAEFFGLWTFATRLASIVGPLSYGAITWATGGNQRVAILATAGLFVAGLLLLMPIDMCRGRAAALGDAAA